jgi:rare lipoprotein A
MPFRARLMLLGCLAVGAVLFACYGWQRETPAAGATAALPPAPAAQSPSASTLRPVADGAAVATQDDKALEAADHSGVIDSAAHPLLKGLPVKNKYLPLLRNAGENRKFKTQIGTVSYCADEQASASGRRFDPDELVGAHGHYPFGSIVRCTNLSNAKSVIVQIVDRGPFVNGRILDLSEAAGRRIGLLHKGVTKCRVEVLAYPREID